MRRTPERRAGFTLTEILTVMILIAIILSIAYPTYISVVEQARKTQAKNEEQQIAAAVNAYYTDYGKYPLTPVDSNDAYFGPAAAVPPPMAATTTKYGVNNDLLIDVLRNNTGSPNNAAAVTTLNPRATVYLNVLDVKDYSSPRSGVIPNNAVVNPPARIGVWYDPFGSGYNVVIDNSYNNQITNPYTDNPGGTTVNNGVIVWSFGKNGALGGGPAAAGSFSAESGSVNNFSASGDIISWQ